MRLISAALLLTLTLVTFAACSGDDQPTGYFPDDIEHRYYWCFDEDSYGLDEIDTCMLAALKREGANKKMAMRFESMRQWDKERLAAMSENERRTFLSNRLFNASAWRRGDR